MEVWICTRDLPAKKQLVSTCVFFPFFFFVRTLLDYVYIYIYIFVYTWFYIHRIYDNRYTLEKLPSLKITGCFRERNDAVFHHVPP